MRYARYKNKMNRKAQVTLEVCLLIILVVAGFLVMQGYLKRAIQGNWKTNTDSFSDEQFEKGVSYEQSANPALEFRSPRLKAESADNTVNQDFDLANISGIKPISGWGTYGHD